MTGAVLGLLLIVSSRSGKNLGAEKIFRWVPGTSGHLLLQLKVKSTREGSPKPPQRQFQLQSNGAKSAQIYRKTGNLRAVQLLVCTENLSSGVAVMKSAKDGA